MRLKLTVTLLVILMGLMAYILYIEPKGGDIIFDDESQTAFGELVSDVDYIRISNIANNTALTIEKSEQRWNMTQPFLWPANEYAVENILTELRFLDKKVSFEVGSIIQTGNTLADYGLLPPQRLLTFGQGENRYTVGIGNPTEVGGHLYLLSADRQFIHVVDQSLLASLSLSFDQLRDSRIFTSGIFEVDSWNLTVNQTDNNQLSNVRTRLSRQEKGWDFETPIRTRANTPSVNTLLNRILSMEAVSISEGNTDLGAIGLQSPSFRIAIETGKQREVIDIGQKIQDGPNTGLRYAKREDRSTVFLVNLDFEEVLLNTQTKLRDRRILTVDVNAASSVVIQTTDEPPLTLQRLENNDWEILMRDQENGIATVAGDRKTIEEVLTWLNNLQAVPDTGFVNDAPSAPDLERYGLEVPRTTISITSRRYQDQDNVLPIPVTEHIQIGDLNPNNPFERYIKLKNRDFVYFIYDDLISQVPNDAKRYQDRQVIHLKNDEFISSVKLVKLADKSVLFDSQPGQPIDRDIENLKAELRDLRADAFVFNNIPENVTIAGKERPWAYELSINVVSSAPGAEQAINYQILVSELTGGPLLIGASQQKGYSFRFEQSFVDAFTEIAFERVKREVPTEPFAPSPQTPESALPLTSE
ncbi:DUF4340 domain-containing protein [Puniceicoccaceae bacterium K14]|nr:DUF4340 domain-containing protein [Puniceicoccaceae bacterium K14]